jgi:site-specific DNA-methyltransferase (adenine-specific)
MPNDFLDCVITSPPYWQLRDYGYDGQWGLEPTFQEYLEHLWEMMDEIYRVLKPTGTCWINLGDTYSRKGGKSIGKLQPNALLGNTKKGVRGGNCNGVEGVMEKCLLLIPHRFAIGCIDRGWIVRNDIIWAKRNAMPESCTDRFAKKHEYFFFMVKSEKYHFDLDAIRDKTITPPQMRNKAEEEFGNGTSNFSKGERQWGSDKGKNPGSISDFWDIPTKPSTNEHYASYNDDLIRKPILGGCPVGGIIYDPFMGTGSTAEASLRANRQFIGSEMSEKYVEICNTRLEPFLIQQKLF